MRVLVIGGTNFTGPHVVAAVDWFGVDNSLSSRDLVVDVTRFRTDLDFPEGDRRVGALKPAGDGRSRSC